MRRVAIILLLAHFGAAAQAGRYQVTYNVTDGRVDIVGPYGGTWNDVYNWTIDSSAGGSGISSEPPNPPIAGSAGPGSVTCSGEIIVKFTWIPDFPGDHPPQALIVEKFASASWSGESGYASNGLGDLAVGGPWSQVSSGTHYELKQDPGGYFELIVSPTAGAYLPWNSPSEVVAASASVYLLYRAHPLEIDSVFAVKTLDTLNFLVGQQADFFVTGGGGTITLDEHFWRPGARCIGGVEFGALEENEVVDGYYYEYRETFLPHFLSAHPSWFYEGSTKRTSIRCRVRVSVSGVPLGYADLSRSLVVHAPRSRIEPFPGPHSVADPDPYLTDDAERARAGSYGFSLPGLQVLGMLRVPAIFEAAQGAGEWAYVQLVEDHATLVRPWPWGVFEYDEEWGLDNVYPYPGIIKLLSGAAPSWIFVDWRPAIGTSEMIFADSPSLGVARGTQFSRDFTAEIFVVLRPPLSPGQSSVELPILALPWDYQANSTRPGLAWEQVLTLLLTPAGHWETTPLGSGVTVQSVRNPAFSIEMDWDHVLFNIEP